MNGWRTPINSDTYTVKYNDTIVSVAIHISSGVPYKTTEQTFGAEILKDSTRGIDLRPSMPIYNYQTYNQWIWLTDNSYNLHYKGVKDTTGSAYGLFTYARR